MPQCHLIKNQTQIKLDSPISLEEDQVKLIQRNTGEQEFMSSKFAAEVASSRRPKQPNVYLFCYFYVLCDIFFFQQALSLKNIIFSDHFAAVCKSSW